MATAQAKTTCQLIPRLTPSLPTGPYGIDEFVNKKLIYTPAPR